MQKSLCSVSGVKAGQVWLPVTRRRNSKSAYMKAGQLLRKDCEVESVAADAVSVGNDHILNVFLWNNVAEKAFHCPPQALASVLDLFLSEMSEFPQSERRHMPEASLRHICRKCLSKWAQDICRKCFSVLWPKSSQKRRFWHLPNIYAGSVSLNGPKHICRKCLSVFARPKGKKPTAHICRKCLSKGSETHMPEVSLRFRPTKRKKAYGPHTPEVSLRHLCRKCHSKSRFWRRFFLSQKRRFWPLFDVQNGLWKRGPWPSFLKGTLPRSPGARSPALCGPESKARALKTARPARPRSGRRL